MSKLVREGPRPVKCPVDRTILKAFNDHRLISEISSEYLARHPEEKRSDDEIEEMNKLYQPGKKVFLSP